MNRLAIALTVAIVMAVVAWIRCFLVGDSGYLWFLAFLISVAVAVTLGVILICPPNRRRYWSLRLAAIWFGLTLGLGAAEFLAFAWPTDHLSDNPWYMSTGEAMVADPDLPWVRPPNLHWTGWSRGDLAMETNSEDPEARIVTFQTDFEGFRNSRDLIEADILFIGDSFTEAGNVPEEETFVVLAGQRLNQTPRNLGVAGYSASMELVVLQKYGLKCNPKCVVWQIAETNDLDDAMFFVQWQQAGRPSVLPGFSQAKPSRSEGWKRRSPTYRIHGVWRDEQPWPFAGDFVDRNGKSHTLRFEMSFLADTASHPGWPVLEHYLSAGAEILKEQKIPLLVMLIPRKLRVMAPVSDIHEITVPSEQGEMTIKHSLPAGWDLEPAQRLTSHLNSLCQRLEVEYLDTTDVLSQHAAQGDLVYQSMDTHLSPLGHRIVAELIAQKVQAMQQQPREGE